MANPAADLNDYVFQNLDPSTHLTEDEEQFGLIDQTFRAAKSPAGGRGMTQLGQFGVGESKYDYDVTPYDILFHGAPHTGRATRQSSGEQLGAMLNQAIVGELVGGTMEGVGYLFDVQQTVNALQGDEQDWGNWLSDVGKDVRTWTQEETPIYADYEPGTFRPDKWSWWMTNAPSMASTLSLMIPAAGAVKGMSMVGKAMGLGKQLSKGAKWMATGLAQASVSRLMENGMEASGTFDETYEQRIQEGLTPEEAKKNASIAASTVWNANWVMLAQDIPQYLLLNGMGKVGSKATVATAKAMGHSILQPALRTGKGIAWDMFSEGGEEAYQYIVSEEGKYLSEMALDPSTKSTFSKRFSKYIADGELWTSAFWGAMGAGALQTVGRRLNEVILNKKDVRVQDIESYGTQLSYWAEKYRIAERNGDPISKETARAGMVGTLGVKAAQLGNLDNAIEFAERMANPSEEDLQRFGVDQADLADFEFAGKDTVTDLKRIGEIYKDNFKNKKFKQDPRKVGIVTQNHYMLEKLQQQRTETEKIYNERQDAIINFSRLSVTKQDIEFNKQDKASVKRVLDFEKKRLKIEEDLTDGHKALIEERIKDLQVQYDALVQEGKELTKNYSAEDKKEDSKYKIDSKAAEEAFKTKDRLSFIDNAIRSVQQNLEQYEKGVFPEMDDAVKDEQQDEEDESIPQVEDTVQFTSPDGEEFNTRAIVKEVDPLDPSKYILQGVDEEGNLVGDPFPATLDNLTLLRKTSKEPDTDTVEPVDDSDTGGTTQSPTEGRKWALKDVSSALHYLGIDKTGNFIVDDPAFGLFVSNPANTLRGAKVTFAIDTTTPYGQNFWKGKEKALAKIEKGNLSPQEIGKLLKVELENEFDSLIDEIPISITITSKGKTFSEGIYYFRSGYDKIAIPEGIENEEQYKDQEKQKIRKNRRWILKEILSGNTPVITNVVKDTGRHNNIRNAKGEPARNNIPELLGIPANQIEGGIADSTNQIWVSDNKDMGIFGLPGNVFFTTTMTANKEPAVVKANLKKLTSEHADILFDAILARYSGRGGSQILFDDPRVEGLTIGEVIDLLVLYGEKKTSVTFPENAEMADHLKNKQLYVISKGTILVYGDPEMGGGQIGLHDVSNREENKKHFMAWVTANKNYAVSKKVKSMGLELNKPFKKKFKIGDWEHNGKDTYFASLLKQEIVTTDLEKFEGESLFKFPQLRIDFSESAAEIEAAQPKVKKTPEVKKQGKKQEATQEKDQGDEKRIGRNIKGKVFDFTKLPAGSQVFTKSEVVKQDGTKEEIRRVHFEIVPTEKGTKFSTEMSPFKEVKAANDKNTSDEAASKTILAALEGHILYYTVDDSVLATKTPKEKPIKTAPDEKDITQVDNLDDVMGELGLRRRTYGPIEYEYMDLEAELKWFRNKYGNKPIHLQDKILEWGHEGIKAFGVYRHDSITLWRGAETGTLYHEAFHRVSLGYLTPEQREKIYTEAKKKYNLEGKSDNVVEEKLAEEFRLYVLNDGKYTKPGRWTKQWFRELLDMITTFFTGKTRLRTYDIDRLFESIQRRRFRYSRIQQENAKIFDQTPGYLREFRGVEFEMVKDSHHMRTIVKGLTKMLLQTNNVTDINSIPNIKYTPLIAWLEKSIKQYKQVAENNEAQAKDALYYASLYEEILDKFGVVQGYIEDHLRLLNIRRKVEDIEEEDPQLDGGIEKLDKASYETSTKDNILASVKFLIATLNKSSQRDPNTNMLEFVDFGETWSELMNYLHEMDTVEEMLTFLKESDNYAFQQLAKKLDDGDWKLRTQFEVSMRKHRHGFVNIMFDYLGGEFNFKLTDADTQRAEKMTWSSWNDTFRLDTDLVTRETDKGEQLNGKALKSLRGRYETLKKKALAEFKEKGSLENTLEYKSEIVSLLGEYGINIDGVSLDKLLEGREGTADEAIKTYISRDLDHLTKYLLEQSKVKGVDIATLFSEESTIKALARAHVAVHPEEVNDSILGPDGATYYTYALNNYLTDVSRMIRKDSKYVEKLSGVISNGNSVYIDQLSDPAVAKKFNIKTFSGFFQEFVGDRGRNFLQISPVEDYLLKLFAVSRGKIPFPTLADRKSFYFYEGLQKLDFRYVIDKDVLRIPDNVIDIFYGYALDEKARIDDVRKTIEEYKNAKGNAKKALEAKLVNNIHYIEDEKGKKNFVNANGLKFQHFKGLVEEDFADERVVKAKITTALEARIQEELDLALDLGVINQGEAGVYENNSIDSTIVNANYKVFENTDFSIKNTIAEFAINSMISTIETEKIFSGDPSYYASDKRFGETEEDKIKRLIGMNSTGDLLRMAIPELDITNTFYNTATLSTQRMKSVYYDELLTKHTELITKRLQEDDPKLSEEDATAKAKVIAQHNLAAYKKVDQTDAQVYISPEMFRDIAQRLGEWDDSKEEAYNILQSPDKVLTFDEEQKLVNLVMQPLKMVHFGFIFEGNWAIPTYDKMSMATLFRRVVAGTHAEDLLDRMEAKGKYEGQQKIGMVKFDSAVKVGGRKKSEYYTNNTSELTKDTKLEVSDLNELEIYPQDYRFLRRQLTTDPHDIERTKTGTQFIKIGMSNILKDTEAYRFEGKNVTGQTVIEAINDSLAGLSNRGRRRLIRRLGFENGQLDNVKFIDLLKREAKLAGMPDNVVDNLKIDEDGDLYLQLDAFSDRDWIQSRLISIVNKFTVDLKLPGNQFIQQSNFALLNINQTVNDDLKFYRYENGRPKAMEAYVSINLFKHIIPEYENLTPKEREDWLGKNLEMIGYRIPTQGLNSVSSLIIKGFLPEAVGDTIILPTEFTALTGSDFDIDKLFVIRYNYERSGNKLKRVPFSIKESELSERYERMIWELFYDSRSIMDKDFYALLASEKIDIHQNLRKRYKVYGENANTLKYLLDQEEEIREEYYEAEGDVDKSAAAEKLHAVNAEIYSLEADQNISQDFQIADKKQLVDLREIVRKELVKLDLLPDTEEEFGDWDIYRQNTRKAIENRLMGAYQSVLTSEAHYLQTTTPLGVLKDKLKEKATDNVQRNELAMLESASARYQNRVKLRYMMGKGGVAPNALANVHHVLSQLVDLKMKRDIGVGHRDENGYTDLSQIYGLDGVPITDWISALIDAHVDVANDSYIIDLNVNNLTYNTLLLMIRAGVGEMAFDFVSQPILKEYAEEYINSRGIIGAEFAPVNKVRQAWLAKLSNAAALVDETKIPSVFNQEQLQQDAAGKTTMSDEYVFRQLEVLERFRDLRDSGEYLRELVVASQVDTKKFGSNLSELQVFMNTIKKVYDDNLFINYEKIIPYDYETNTVPETEGALFLGAYLDNSILLAQELFGAINLSGTDGYMKVMAKLLQITGNEYTRDKAVVSAISKEIFAYFSSMFFIKKEGFGMTASKLEDLVLGDNSIVSRVSEIQRGKKHPELKDNTFLKILTPMFDEASELKKYFTVRSARDQDKWDRDDITNSWEDLLIHEDPEVRQLGVDLILYAFYASGFRRGIQSFYQFIPSKYMREMDRGDGTIVSFNEFLIDSLNILGNPKNLPLLVTAPGAVLQNNWYDNIFVPYVRPRRRKRAIVDKVVRDKKTGQALYAEVNAPHLYLGQNEDGNEIYRTYIKTTLDKDLQLMQYVGYYWIETDEGAESIPIYKVIERRSIKKRGIPIKEYFMTKSISPSNNVPGLLSDETEGAIINKTVKGFAHVPIADQTLYHSGFDSDVYRGHEGAVTAPENVLRKGPVEPTAIEEFEEPNIPETGEIEEGVFIRLKPTADATAKRVFGEDQIYFVAAIKKDAITTTRLIPKEELNKPVGDRDVHGLAISKTLEDLKKDFEGITEGPKPAAVYTDSQGSEIEMTRENNPNVWAIENAEDLILEWKTVDGKKEKVYKYVERSMAIAKQEELQQKYPGDEFILGKTGDLYRVIVLSDYPGRTIISDITTEYKSRAKERREIRRIMDMAGTSENSLKSILQDLSTNERVVPEYQTIIHLLLNNVDSLGTKVVVRDSTAEERAKKHVAYYDPDSNTIELLKDRIGKYEYSAMLIHNIVHEVVHAYTYRAMIAPKNKREKQFAKEVAQIHEAFKEQFRLETKQEPYGLLDKYEFVAELYSNPGFAFDLMRLQSVPTKLNTWQRFVNAVLKLLGYNIYYKDNVEPSALMLQAIKGIIQQVNSVEYIENIDGSRKVAATENPLDFVLPEDLKTHEMVSKELSGIEEVLDKSIKALEHKVAIYKRSKFRQEQQRAEKFIKQIKEIKEPAKALLGFVTQAHKSTNTIFREYQDFKERDVELTPQILYKWRDYLSAWDTIQEYSNYILEDPELRKNKKELFSIMQDTLAKKKMIQDLYRTKGLDIMVDFLEPYYGGIYAAFRKKAEVSYNLLKSKKDPIVANLTKEEYISKAVETEDENLKAQSRATLRKELLKASRDISTLTRWLENLLDSRDPVVQAMVQGWTDIEDVSHRAALAMSQEMAVAVQELETVQRNRIGTNVRDIYEFMLEKNDKGEFTGHYITKWKSAMMDEYYRVLEATRDMDYEKIQLLVDEGILFEPTEAEKQGQSENAWVSIRVAHTKGILPDEKARDMIRQTWKNVNAKLNQDAFQKGLWMKLSEMETRKLISPSELDIIGAEQQLQAQSRRTFSEMVEDGDLSQTAADELIDWIYRNVWNYRMPGTKWSNPQWTDLLQSAGISLTLDEADQWKKLRESKDPKIKFYLKIVDMSREADKNIPYQFRLGSRLPGMEKRPSERIKAGQSPMTIFREGLKRTFTVRPDEIERGNEELRDEQGNVKYFLPIHFTSKFSKTVEVNGEETEVFDVDRQSFDVATMYYKYWVMAKDYQLKSEILPKMEMAKFFVDQRPAINRSPAGEVIKKVFSKAKDKDDIKDTGGSELRKTRLSEQIQDFFLSVVYGQKVKKQGEFKLGNVYIDVAKVFDAVNRYVALDLLGLNFVQATANVILGETLQMIEAFAGHHTTMKSYNKAHWFYTKNMPGVLGDIGARKRSNLVTLLAESFDILDNYEGKEFRKNTKFRQLMEGDTLFFTQHAGEHYMQNRFLLSMLNDKIAYDKEGNNLGTMLDMYEKGMKDYKADLREKHGSGWERHFDGQLRLAKEVDREKSHWTPEEERAFGRKVRGVLTSLHGEYTDLGRVAIQRGMLGRMAYMFRKFVIPGFQRRWAREHYNARIDEMVEGNYISTGRFVRRYVRDLSRMKFNLAGENWVKLTNAEKAAVHKTFAEAAFIATAWILGNILFRLKGETDDDDETGQLAFWAYQAYRLKAELLFFSPKLDEAMSILRSPAASMSFAENTIKLAAQIWTPGNLYERGPWKGQPKIYKTLSDMTPGLKQYFRLRDIEQQITWFK